MNYLALPDIQTIKGETDYGYLCNFNIRFPVDAGPKDTMTVFFSSALNVDISYASGISYAAAKGV